MLKSLYIFRENEILLNVDVDDFHGNHLEDLCGSLLVNARLVLQLSLCYRNLYFPIRLRCLFCICPDCVRNLIFPIRLTRNSSNRKIKFKHFLDDFHVSHFILIFQLKNKI